MAGSGAPSARDLPAEVVVADTITKLPAKAAGAVVISGSHGGRYPGYLAARAGVRAAILCDAGIGLDAAGVAALGYLDELGIAAACVSHLSCRIGDTADMQARGRISRANAAAGRVGVVAGDATLAAAGKLRAAPHVVAELDPIGELRRIAHAGARRIVLLDSAAAVAPEDRGQIVVTGSHGGLVGGDPAMALRVDAYAAVFNDAGIGIDEAGLGRLPALDARGIAAFTVAADSARIGDAASTLEDGLVSAVNRTAERMGARVGARALAIARDWAG